MFDKLKDMMSGDASTVDAQEAIGDASQAISDAKAEAQAAVDSASASTDSASIDQLAGSVSGLMNQAGGLDGIVKELGGLGGLLSIAKSVDFPIGVDDLEPILKQFGISGSGSNIVQGLISQGITQIDSPDDLINIAKKFLSK